MFLPCFDLAAEIAKCNLATKSHYAADDDFGYAYLKKSVLALTHQTIHLINAGHALHVWTPEELRYKKERDRLLKASQAYCRDPKQGKPEGLREWIAAHPLLEQQLQQKLQLVEWLQVRQEALAKEEQWQLWLTDNRVTQKARLKQLQRDWQAYSPMVRFTPQALVAIAEEHLPLLIQHQTSALANLWRQYWFMPEAIYRAYQQYLKTFLTTDVKRTEQQLVAVMLARLEAFDSSHSEDSNPFVHLYHTLQVHCGIESNITLPMAKQPLTSAHLMAFHRYIDSHGDAAAKERLRQLSWFKPSEGLATQYLSGQANQGGWLVPTALAPYIPVQPRWPSWLFKGTYFRYTFFQNQFVLLIALKQVPTWSAATLDLEHLSPVTELLAALQAKEQWLAHALQALQQTQPQGFTHFWQQKTQRFLHLWRLEITHYRFKLIDSKLKLAETLADTISQHYPDLLAAAILPWDACVLLKKLLTSLNAALAEATVESQHAYNLSALQQRLATLQQRSEALLATHQAYQFLESLAAGQPITASDKDYLIDFFNATQLYNPTQSQSFLTCCQPLVNQSFKHLQQAFKENPFVLGTIKPDYQALARHQALLINTSDVLLQVNTDAEKKLVKAMIEKQVKKYCLTYLENLLRCQAQADAFEAHQASLATMETVIIHLGSEIPFIQQTLACYCIELQQLRQARQWSLVHCRAFALANLLADAHFNQRLLKELDTIHTQLILALQLPQKGHSPSTLQKTVHALSEELASVTPDKRQVILAQLPLYQRLLLGLTDTKDDARSELLCLSADVQAARQIAREKKPLAQKREAVQALACSLKHVLQTNPLTAGNPALHVTPFGRRPILSKTRLDERLLALPEPEKETTAAAKSTTPPIN